MKKTFVQLQELYSELGRRSEDSPTAGNPCGECFSCCQAKNIRSHRVSALELDFLEESVGKEKTDRFRDYIARKKDGEGKLLYDSCPNYESGCTVHLYRPYSCRMYGVFRTDRQRLIAHCVFQDSVKVLPHKQERELLPGNITLQKLMVDYLLSSGTTDELREVDFQEHESDPASLGTYYLSLSEFEKAAQVLEGVVKDDPHNPLYLWELAQAYESLDRREEALTHLLTATQLEPSNATYLLGLANCLFFLGRPQEAANPYFRVTQLNPKHVSAHGMLGVCLFNLGLWKEASMLFDATLELETEPSIFRFQYAELLRRTGDLDRARAMYISALECPLTAKDAEAYTSLGL